MIISKTVRMKKRGNKNLKYYQDLGYIIDETFEVYIKDLTLSSKILVNIECDICEKEVKRPYNLYLKNISSNNIFSCSPRCGKYKTIKTNLEKYGVEYATKNNNIKKKIIKTTFERYGVKNISQLEDVKNKVKQTNLEKYGVEYVLQNSFVKDRGKKTMIERYGVDHNMKSDLTKYMVKQTNLEKYGVENVSQLEKIKDKKKETLIKNYGVDNPLKSEIIKNKIKKINLTNLGVEWPMQSETVKEKSKKTLLEKYGVDHNTKSDIVKDNMKLSNLEKYGVEYTLQLKEVKENIIKTNIANWGETHPSKSDLYRKDNFIMSKDKNYIEYNGDSISSFRCDLGHNYQISSSNYHSRINSNIPLCTICNPIGDSSSIKEKELYNYILSIYNGDLIRGYKDKYEIDIYLPELNIGFEFNGLYWHCNKNKDKNYHLDKTSYFNERGINLIHIWEDDWDYKSDIIKSKIRTNIGITEHKIYAKECKIKRIDNIDEYRKFLNENHIQGYISATIKIGLYYNDEIVSLISFNYLNDEWNLSRFCDKLNHNVIDGDSTLLNYFIKNYTPIKITTYVNKDWLESMFYYKMGFIIESELDPDYKYIFENKRINKYKSKNLDITNINRIYDCGKTKFTLNLK